MEDYFIVGHLKMINTILGTQPRLLTLLLDKGLLDFLLKECLFSFEVKAFEGDITKKVNLA